jgi:formate hydrogenlyase subunit 3/multisubunit Na+/H+ antiporter MnhD subunit
LVPLHTWLPDAHAQAPSGISAMLSGIVIGAALIALVRVLAALGPAGSSWGGVLMAMAVINMLTGNLLALRQTHVKRLLAYSSVAQMGYVALGLGIALSTGAPAPAAGALFHLGAHAVSKGLAFLAAGALICAAPPGAPPGAPLTTADLGGAARRYPFAGFALSVAVLSLGGLPPFAGFMSKWQIFAGAASTGMPAAIALVAFAATNSVLSLAYYAPLVNALYRREASETVRRGGPMPAAMTAVLVVLTAAVIALGVWPGLTGWFTGAAGAAILRR